MKRTPVIVTLAGMAALAVTGTALAATGDDGVVGTNITADDSPSATPGPDDSPSPFDSPDVSPTPDDSATSTGAPLATNITADQARKIALGRVGGGTVTKIESELEHGFSTWKVEVVRSGVEHDIYVDRASGRIIKSDSRADAGRATGDDNGGARVGGGRDDSPTHDANDDKGGDRGGHGSDDGAGHDANDDNGGDRGGHGSDD